MIRIIVKIKNNLLLKYEMLESNQEMDSQLKQALLQSYSDVITELEYEIACFYQTTAYAMSLEKGQTIQ